MKTYYLDTNIIIRYLVDDIPTQTEMVREYLVKAKKKQIKLYIPVSVILESFYVLRALYKRTKAETINALTSVINMDYLEVGSRRTLAESLKISEKEGISLTDSLCLCESASLKYQLLTFDKKLMMLSKKLNIF